jgi:hypothetical protein
VRSGPLAACAILLFAVEGRAGDVQIAARRVEAEWRRAGADVAVQPTRFVYDNETARFPIPDERADLPCTTIALVGARGLSFHAKVAGASDDPLLDSPLRASSVAGVLELSSCEADERPSSVQVTNDAGHGAIEVVVARSRAPLAHVRAVLLERVGGNLPAPLDPGPLGPLAAPERRADLAEARARADRGEIEPRISAQANADGAGEIEIDLEEGCHRIEAFAHEPAANARRRPRLDLDAELRDADDVLIGKDKSDAADVHMDVCLGEGAHTTLVFAGAPPRTDVFVTHAFYKLPARLPALWGPLARSRMARAMKARHLASPPSPAILLAQGTSLTTVVPVAVEPGACYLAVTAIVDGPARGIGVRAGIGSREIADERGAADDGGVVAFCAGPATAARIEIEARRMGVTWGLALFRMVDRVRDGTR